MFSFSGTPRMTRRLRVLSVASVLGLLPLGVPSAQPGPPAPAAVLGFAPCADYELATYEQIADYFRQLAAAAPDRMRLVEIGRTVDGRPELMAVISSAANMRRLDRLQAIARALALTRQDGHPLTDAAAHALAREGRAVVWIDFGLHSNEVAHAQTAPLMAYRAVTDDSEAMRFIRDNVVFLLAPNLNPDGTTLVADWYRQHRGTAWEDRLPELYHKYVGHDDNRDWFMMTQPETRNAARQLYAEWFPEIVYNQHQSGPFPSRIFVPPFDDPMNPNIPALVMRGVNTVGDAITRRLAQEGKSGAISRIGFDTWWDGGMRTAPYFHNMIGILTETSHASATPATYDARSFPKTFANGVPTLEPSTFYPDPYRGGEWHLRDSCDYMVTASMAVLDIAARRREEWLYGIYRLGRDAERAGAREAYLVPPDQWDPGTAAKMVNVLRLGGVEVWRAGERFSAGGREHPAGTYVIPGAQPFEPYVRDLLTPQVYPDMRLYPGGPPKRPYDITGWTLSYQMGVRVERLDSAPDVRLEPVDVAPVPTASIPTGRAAAFALDPRSNDAFTAVNRLFRSGDLVYRSTGPVAVADGTWPAGTFLVPPRAGTLDRLGTAARALGLEVAPLARLPPGRRPVHAPRVAVYHGWGGNIDEGWTRWVLEQFEFPYVSLHDDEVRVGDLHARYDVIVLPDATYEQMLNGFAPGTMPPAYTGGMTARGVANLRAFTAAGGTLVAIDRATALPLAAFGPGIRDVAAPLPDTTLYVPGTILRIALDPDDPIAYGMPREAAAFVGHRSAFAVTPVETGGAPAGTPARHVAGTYAAADRLLMSGWLLGASQLAGRPVVVDAAFERGRLVLLGFSPDHRGQPHGTFKLLFNALLLGSTGPAASGSPGEARP